MRLLWLVSVVFCACSSSSAGNKPLADCPDTTCSGGKISGGTGAGAGGGGGGSAGSSGSSGSAGSSGVAAAITVTGTVVQITDSDFTKSQPFTQSALVTTAGVDPATATTTWNGGDAFTLPNVRGEPVWFNTQPIMAGTVLGSNVFIPLPILVGQVNTVQLPVMSQAVMTSVVAQLPGSTGIDATKAQVLLFIRDSAGKPIVGATAAPNFTALVAYDDSSGFSAGQTRALGMVILGNASLAGNLTNSVVITAGGASTAPVLLRLDVNTLTLLTISILSP